MKAVILAGGLGTLISEETRTRPNPMVEVGGRPISQHILKNYSSFGINEFVICFGRKGLVIKEYFANYFLHMSNVTIHMRTNSMEVHHKNAEPCEVTLVDTGEATLTGGRLKRVQRYVGDETFCFAQGDGVSDVDISAAIATHRAAGKLATLTAVLPPGRFGSSQLVEGDGVAGFQQQPQGDGGWVNGGFFVLEPGVLDTISSDATTQEAEPLQRLTAEGQLQAYRHHGYWQPMDTLRDRLHLEELWVSGKATWKRCKP